MKKLIISVGVMLSFGLNAQWINKNVNNGFDDPYRICYTAENNGAVLKLENVDGIIVFYLNGGYYCDDLLSVDFSFIVNGVTKKYSGLKSKSEDNTIVWLVDDLVADEMYLDFKSCSTLKLRITDNICETEIFSFSMAGSTSAINFILNK